MANPERGEVALVIPADPERDKEERRYTLKMSTNVAVTLQKRVGRTVGQLLAQSGGLDYEAIRCVLWLLLQKHHAAEFKKEEHVGDLIDEIGGVTSFFDALRELNRLNTPDKKDGAKKEAGDGGDDVADPSKAQA